MLNFALLLHIYTLTKSTTSISLVLIASALPSIIFGPFSGVLADRLDFKKILIYTNALRFLAVLLLFVSKANVLGVLEIIFLISMITQFFSPAETSSIPVLIPKEKLVAANSVVMTTMYGSLLIGYSLAGPIMTWISPSWLFLVCALLYLVATFSVNRMTEFDDKRERRISLTNLAVDVENIWNETKSSLREVRVNKRILSPMIKLFIGWMMLGCFIVLLPSFGESILKIAPRYVGPAIVLPAGFGMLIGTYILERKRVFSFASAINKGFLVVGAALIMFSVYKYYDGFFAARVISIVLAVLLGLGSSIVYISAQTSLHLNSKDHNRGRVFGIVTMLLNIAISIPALIVGGIADLTSPFIAMLALALIIFIYGIRLSFEDAPKTLPAT